LLAAGALVGVRASMQESPFDALLWGFHDSEFTR